MPTSQVQHQLSSSITPAKILVVEDEELIALVLKNQLKKIGYQVSGIAETGPSAIQLAQEFQPDLVLMDIRLNGEMDGIEAAASITAHLDIPIIFLTALSDSRTLDRAKQVSPFNYIIKPFEVVDVHISIEFALSKHRANQEVKQQRTQLYTILESIGDAVIATDNQGAVMYMNRVAQSITQWQLADAIGKDISEVIPLITGTDKDSLENPLKQVLRGGKGVTLPKDTYLTTKNQEEIPIDYSAVPIIDDQNKFHGAVIVFQDITERLKPTH